MHQMVLLVLDDVNNCTPVLDAWEATGVSGITILDSTGMGRVRAASSYRDDFPLMPSISNLMKSREERHRTIFTVVDTDEMVDKLVQVTQEITGSLEAPNKGVIFVLPVSRAIGLHRE
ncbi:MAG: hypothetical protein CSA11_04220 [Chloroflexi bacterium]|nr:MAG: hypothetical protein CSB13_00260 [Chloroflexota bacterium]PIE81549.1 MAG: hypothetical protein CSA11_04220 [Chloroflexota bacterium]